MQRYANDRAIKTKAHIGKAMTIVGIALMVLGLVFVFGQQERADLFYIFYSLSLAGILLFQVGTMMQKRWGSPRIDEKLDQALKGLDSKYAIFHYQLGAHHALIAPSGIYAIVPISLAGDISFEDGKWRQTQTRRGKSRTKEIKYLESEAELEARSLNRALKRKIEQEFPTAHPLLVFLNPNASLQAEGSTYSAVHVKKIKDYIRKLGKGPTLSQEEVSRLAKKLGLK
jgi:hypothetical protein